MPSGLATSIRAYYHYDSGQGCALISSADVGASPPPPPPQQQQQPEIVAFGDEDIDCPSDVESSSGSSGHSLSSATAVSAEKAAAVKAQVYETFVKNGMSPEEAQHFVDTMPQSLIDDAKEEGDGEGDDSDYDDDGDGEDADGGGMSTIVDLKSVSLLDGQGTKLYKLKDEACNKSSGNCDESVFALTVHIEVAQDDDDDDDDADTTGMPVVSLAVSWEGTTKFEVLLRGKCACIGGGISGGEFRLQLNGEVPLAADELEGSELDVACLKTESIAMRLGGHWTDEAAQRVLAPLFV